MNIENLNEFRKFLIKSKKPVSKFEFTKGNYDSSANLIEESLPTITTDFCEIGLYNNEIYFVFVAKSKTFNVELFNKLKNKSNMKIYGFIDFNKTLFPVKNFNFDNFIKKIKNDKYLQIQFDFKNIKLFDLFENYSNLVNIFEKNKVIIVNQLKVDLTKSD
jgi:hypothetical protein